MRGYYMAAVLVLISVQSVLGQAWSVQLDTPNSGASHVSLKGYDFDSEESDLDDDAYHENVVLSDASKRPKSKLLVQNDKKYFTSDLMDIDSSSNSDWNSDVEDETVLHEIYFVR